MDPEAPQTSFPVEFSGTNICRDEVHQSSETWNNSDLKSLLDDDGRPARKGTMWTASAHIITAVIGSGVLSLAWAISQLGWIAGPGALLVFSLITLYTSSLLADCYRYPDPVNGKRNYTYIDAVKANLGGMQIWLCGLTQYSILYGTAIGYTITASMSMTAITRSNCFHENGKQAPCHTSENPYMIVFGIFQILLSQIPDFDRIWWLSIVAAVMSFGYSSIGLGLALAKVAAFLSLSPLLIPSIQRAWSKVISIKKSAIEISSELRIAILNQTGGHFHGSVTGVTVGTVTAAEKTWGTFRALGNIAFAYSFSMLLIEIQDTVKSPPAENKTMKKATLIGISITTTYYMLCGCLGYAAFGNISPGNLLTGFGFYNPFWLVDLANVFIVVHLVGAYQVFVQPLFAFIEHWSSHRWPKNKFIHMEYNLNIPRYGLCKINLFKLVWRTCFVVTTTIISMMLPFFTDVLSLLGAVGFWPLTVYFPVEMYIVHRKIQRFTSKWMLLQTLSFVCLLVSLAAACGSIEGVVQDLKMYKPFRTTY